MKQFISMVVLGAVLLATACISCSSDDDDIKTNTVEEGNDINFKIVANNDKGFSGLNRKVEVFGIPIYAVPNVKDSKLLHAANVMAQYLDNDEDGKVDNQQVLDKMKENKAFLFMWASESDMETVKMPEDAAGQDLGNDETNPDFVKNGRKGEFDASLEEVWHLINFAGHCKVYPEVFGLEEGTALAEAMDVARGGKFLEIPQSYPEGAWYTYDDKTCSYADCQTVEYFYWAMSSILGAQENRSAEIGHEWKLHTKKLVEEKDPDIYSLLTDPKYKFPTVLPDGSYRN
ncbi:hypothetical protein [Marinifilum breve]|nr:hypothetical protein [Marinifilum breve]